MFKVVVLGGGLSGVESAIELRKYGFDVTLVSNREYLYIYPASIWIPTSKINFKDASISLDVLSRLHKFELVIDEVTSIDDRYSKVKLNGRELNYNYLVVAIGADKMKLDGMDNTLSICGNPEESMGLKYQFDNLISSKKGNIAIGFTGNPKDESAIRGGPAFELLFNFIDKLKELNIYSNYNITLFSPAKEIGKKLGDKPYEAMQNMLKKDGINVKSGVKISKFETDAVLFEDGEKISSDLTMFISGLKGFEWLKSTNLPLNEAGFIEIDDSCRVVNHKNIYAVGDCSAIIGPKWRAKQGHLSEIMARNCAYNISQDSKNSTLTKSYKDSIKILCLMDMGSSGVMVYRNSKSSYMIPLLYLGHLMKKLWLRFYKKSKLKIKN